MDYMDILFSKFFCWSIRRLANKTTENSSSKPACVCRKCLGFVRQLWSPILSEHPEFFRFMLLQKENRTFALRKKENYWKAKLWKISRTKWTKNWNKAHWLQSGELMGSWKITTSKSLKRLKEYCFEEGTDKNLIPNTFI